MVFNLAALIAASTGFRAVFAEALHATTPYYTDLCEEVPSTGSTEVYHFPDGLGDLREWVGSREEQPILMFPYPITNKTWEKTLTIPREAVEDDQLGSFNGSVKLMGASAKSHPDSLLATLLTGGFTTNGYDGVPFFSATHPQEGGSTQSNIVSGALSETTFNTAMQRLLGIQDYYGKPIDPMGMGGELVLVVGPSLRATALQIVERINNDAGAGNINYKAARVVIFPRLTGSHWFLMVAKGPVRPFVLQMRRKPEFVSQTALDSDTVFAANEFKYGVSGRWNAGYAFWQLAVGSTGS
jgi:phage major head subunit gpT-like protein